VLVVGSIPALLKAVTYSSPHVSCFSFQKLAPVLEPGLRDRIRANLICCGFDRPVSKDLRFARFKVLRVRRRYVDLRQRIACHKTCSLSPTVHVVYHDLSAALICERAHHFVHIIPMCLPPAFFPACGWLPISSTGLHSSGYEYSWTASIGLAHAAIPPLSVSHLSSHSRRTSPSVFVGD